MPPDNLTAEQRHKNMANIRSQHTKPEIVVRKLLHALGYRFRLHYKPLVGKPDIVLPRHKKIVLIHGCFWHMHNCKRGNVFPKTNAEFWSSKRLRTTARDKNHLVAYRKLGYGVCVVWECEGKNVARLTRRLVRFLTEVPLT